MSDSVAIPLETIRRSLSSALICDALDRAGFRDQSPRITLSPLTVDCALVGRCKTTLWCDVDEVDPEPYEKELLAVDQCRDGDVLIAAANGSNRSGIWGELLSTAAKNRGCCGAIVDGCVRDVRQMRQMSFSVFARGVSPYDSKNRQCVTEIDVTVQIGGVDFHPGDLVFADLDGIVVIPQAIEMDVIRSALEKVVSENQFRNAIREGLSATEAYRQFGVL